MNKIDTAFKISKIAYYGVTAVVGVIEMVVFGAFWLSCTKKEKEEKSSENAMESN